MCQVDAPPPPNSCSVWVWTASPATRDVDYNPFSHDDDHNRTKQVVSNCAAFDSSNTCLDCRFSISLVLFCGSSMSSQFLVNARPCPVMRVAVEVVTATVMRRPRGGGGRTSPVGEVLTLATVSEAPTLGGSWTYHHHHHFCRFCFPHRPSLVL